MAVIQDLLRRLGFVKLGRYGLTLTADDRIASTRPTVLDNGAGLRIVGWRDDDLAMTELSPWYPDILAAHRPAQRRVQFPVMPPMPAPAAPRTTAQLPAMQPVISKPSGEAQVAAPAASARVMPVAVAAEAAVDEDDWEWTIALARARAADEPTAAPLPVQPTAAAPSAPSVQTPPLFAMSSPAMAVQPLTAHSMPARSMPAQQIPAPVTAPPLLTPNPRVAPSSPAPSTVIPVPRLPSIRDAERSGRFDPVVRTTIGPAPAPPPSRLAKGTAPIGSDTEQTPAVSDDTQLTLSVGDRTTPGVALPLAARPVTLPSIKRGTLPRPRG
jgi:hypothetical protein